MGTITVNGTPLKTHIDDQLAKEISDVHTEQTHMKVRVPRKTASARDHSGAKSGKAYVPYMGDPLTTHIYVCGQLFPVAEKAPFVRSGLSVLGAAEYRETTEQFKCHDCGQWYRDLATHSRKHSSVYESFSEYKLSHGLNVSRGIIGPSRKKRLQKSVTDRFGIISKQARQKRMLRAVMFRGSHQHLRTEHANLFSLCQEQTMRDASVLYCDKGKIPSLKEMALFKNKEGRRSLHPSRIADMFGTVSGFWRRLLSDGRLPPPSVQC